jgi:G:T-mismatch repair DNA endonuclease (very short patch repair protein)
MAVLKDSINDFKKISKIDSSCEELHVTKAFSIKYFIKIINKCKRLKKITMSKTTKERLGKKTKEILRKNKINVSIKNEQGRPIDIPTNKLQKILLMHKDYSYRDLEEKLKVPKSTIHYLIKKSKKKKLKDGNKIIYLK